MPEPVHLRALADRLGIVSEFWDMCGRRRVTSDETRMALLAAMGVDAGTEGAAEAAARGLDAELEARLLPPARVAVRAEAGMLTLRLPEGGGEAGAEVAIEIAAEGGERRCIETRVQADTNGRMLRLEMPLQPEIGYHRVHAAVHAGGRQWQGTQLLVVAPERCPAPAERIGERRVFGLLANLYTVRSERNWGAGDFTDLAELARWCGEIGGDFVGVNPLHALRNCGDDISPYRPVSRLYRNPLYLDVTAVPEFAESAAARRRAASRAARVELRRLREAAGVDYEGVMALKSAVLKDLHRAFARRHRDRDTERGRAYRRYLEQEGELLADFATFTAIRDHLTRRGAAPAWRQWPAAYRHPRSQAVAEFRAAHAEDVDFQSYLQFEIDRQMESAAAAARHAGSAIGIYQDLALGSSPDGSDAWAFPGLLLDDLSLGAPPDDYSPVGQDWGLPPMHPRLLVEDGFRYWVRLIRSALRHGGALRIDHVMGLFRQFWIPHGRPASEGAYVRFPAEEMFGILALEAARAGAIVVGEDLGTVPDEVRALMDRFGLLSSRVMYFEQQGEGEFRPAAHYPRRALVTANTHDLAPLAGFWKGRDIALRRTVGLIPAGEAFEAARGRREREKEGLLRALAAGGAMSEGTEPRAAPGLCAAVHAFLCGTDADMVGLSLDDLSGETEPVNLPGVGLDRYPSWSRKMGRTIESLRDDPAVAQALAGTTRRSRGRDAQPQRLF